MILIYGSNGWIGKQIADYLTIKNIKFIQGIERVENISLVKKEIETHNPSHILCIIGRTHGEYEGEYINTIDYLEKDGKLVENIRDNLFCPMLLALFCKSKNIHLTYFGTGCIFDYEHNELTENENLGFTEEDEPNFFGSSYSIVKGFTDGLMKDMDNVLNLRIRMPIIDKKHPRNFITKIITYEKVCSIPNSMSVLPNLIPYLIEMVLKKTVGTINFTNPGVISHNEILQMYKEIVDPSFTWINFSIDEQNKVLASKRSNNRLNTDKLQTMFPDVKNIKEAVRECLINYK